MDAKSINPDPFLCELHSFIHFRDLYHAPSRSLLRSAPSPSTVIQISLMEFIERGWIIRWLQEHHPQETVPERWTNNWKSTKLVSWGVSTRDQEFPARCRAIEGHGCLLQQRQGRRAHEDRFGDSKGGITRSSQLFSSWCTARQSQRRASRI